MDIPLVTRAFLNGSSLPECKASASDERVLTYVVVVWRAASAVHMVSDTPDVYNRCVPTVNATLTSSMAGRAMVAWKLKL